MWTTTQPAKSHLSTDRNQVRQMCLWFNQMKQKDCYIILVKHHSWLAGERWQTVHLNINATTSAQTFIFTSFQQYQWLLVAPLKYHKTTKAMCTVKNIHIHVCTWRVYIHTVFWLTFVSWFMSNISVPTTRMHRAAAASLCTTIYIIYITLRKSNSACDRQLLKHTYLEKGKKSSWHFRRFKGFSHKNKMVNPTALLWRKRSLELWTMDDVIFTAGDTPHHSTAFLSDTEIKDWANEKSPAINKTHHQWDLMVSIKTDVFTCISKIYRLS